MKVRIWAGALGALMGASAADAGPPYATDDPVPTDRGKWEVYGFTAATRAYHRTEAEAGFDINYGAAKDLQATVVLPLEYEHDGTGHVGIGDVELGLKYRFVHQREGTIIPDIAFFPKLGTPTAGRRFGSGRLSAFLPLWAEKDLGKWGLFGGGGYGINPGSGNRNFWLTGLAAQRVVTDRLRLGAELYNQTADQAGGHGYTRAAVAGSYRFAEHWSVLASGGPGLRHTRETGRYSVYLGIEFSN